MDEENASYVALPPMFRALGMDWKGQRKKLANHPTLSRHTIGRRVMTASGEHVMTCVPAEKLMDLLRGIRLNMLAPTVRERVEYHLANEGVELLQHFRVTKRLDL